MSDDSSFGGRYSTEPGSNEALQMHFVDIWSWLDNRFFNKCEYQFPQEEWVVLSSIFCQVFESINLTKYGQHAIFAT